MHRKLGIYTSDPPHAEHITMAFKGGKHVICTKPLLTDLNRAAELLELQRKTGKHLLVGQSCRFRIIPLSLPEERDL